MTQAPVSQVPIVREPRRRPAGVWGVRNYHTTLEGRAEAGAAMSWGYVAMVVAAATMATAGARSTGTGARLRAASPSSCLAS